MEGFIEEEAEHFFKPKAGGLVDRFRQEEARLRAAEQEKLHIDERVEERSYKAVKVAIQSPEVLSAGTISIAAGDAVLVLPLSPYRYRCCLQVVTATQSLILAKDKGAAISANGFVLSAGYLLYTHTRAQLWAFNDTTSIVQISFMSELYAPEG